MEGEDDEYIFAHLFLILEGNLISWSENVVDFYAENILWVKDTLGFHFQKTKAKQLGKHSDAVWHIYATCASPQTCTLLKLARLLFSNPGILTMIDSSNASGDDRDNVAIENVEGLGMMTNIWINVDNKLFLGANHYDHFMKCFH